MIQQFPKLSKINGMISLLASIMNCGHCTFLNLPNTQICVICSKPMVSYVNVDGIQCDTCTFLNCSDADLCEMCGADIYVENSFLDSDGSNVEEDILGNQVEMSECREYVALNTKVWYLRLSYEFILQLCYWYNRKLFNCFTLRIRV